MADPIIDECNCPSHPGGAGCTYKASPAFFTADFHAHSDHVDVIAPAGCSWFPEADQSWIYGFNPSYRLSGGSSAFSITQNNGAQRTGNILIKKGVGGAVVQTIPVTQDGEPVPIGCPGHPPLLDQYMVTPGTWSGGQVGGCTYNPPENTGKIHPDGLPFNQAPYLVTKVSPCYWRAEGLPEPSGGWADLNLQSGGYWLFVTQIHIWVDELNGIDTYDGVQFRKYFGSTPVGIYTRFGESCSPQTIEISIPL